MCRLLYLRTRANLEGEVPGEDSPSPADYGVWGSVVSSPDEFSNFLSFHNASAETKAALAIFMIWQKKWQTLNNLQVAVS